MADITLRDRDGTKVNYPGITSVKLNTVDGGTVEFVDSSTMPVLLENVAVVPDFSSGDQVFSAPDGMAVKSGIVKKPDTLIPGNIAEGVNIAGILGTLSAGGSSVVVASGYGYDSITDGIGIISHNLGVVPDLIVVYCGAPTGKNLLRMAVGFSSAFASKLSMLYGYKILMYRYTTYVRADAVLADGGIDTFAAGSQVISAATDTTVTIGTTDTKVTNNTIVSWLAVGGLT